jgi:hypothetical protein
MMKTRANKGTLPSNCIPFETYYRKSTSTPMPQSVANFEQAAGLLTFRLRSVKYVEERKRSNNSKQTNKARDSERLPWEIPPRNYCING